MRRVSPKNNIRPNCLRLQMEKYLEMEWYFCPSRLAHSTNVSYSYGHQLYLLSSSLTGPIILSSKSQVRSIGLLLPRLLHLPFKPIIHSCFQPRKSHNRRSAIGCQAGSAACQPIADRSTCNLRVGKTLQIICLTLIVPTV